MKNKKLLFFLVTLFLISYYVKTLYDMKELDNWLGKYEYTEIFGDVHEEINYAVNYEVIIYKDGTDYYAELRGDGWFLNTDSLAYIQGNKNTVDILFKKTLPGDHFFGEIERYDNNELMLTFTYDDSKLISTWHALRDEYPIFSEKMEGIYFEKQ